MNNDGLQRLKEIGAQKIYEDTHIPAIHIQAILHESFDGLTKIHFIGFVSILQREYNIDLSALKNMGTAYFDEKNPVEVTTKDGIFIAPKKKKNFTLFYILLVMALFFVALYYSVEYANTDTKKSLHVDNTVINDAQKNMNSIVTDENKTQEEVKKTVIDVNETQIKENNATTLQEEKTVAKSFNIVARTKVWLGYIDVKTNKKYQKTFNGEFDLDPNKEWLLIFGHGYINIIIDAQEKKFNSKKTLRLFYKDGEITELTFDEFKKLNRGNAW